MRAFVDGQQIDDIVINPSQTVKSVKKMLKEMNQNRQFSVKFVFNDGTELSPEVFETIIYDDINFQSYTDKLIGGSIYLTLINNWYAAMVATPGDIFPTVYVGPTLISVLKFVNFSEIVTSNYFKEFVNYDPSIQLGFEEINIILDTYIGNDIDIIIGSKFLPILAKIYNLLGNQREHALTEAEAFSLYAANNIYEKINIQQIPPQKTEFKLDGGNETNHQK